MQPLARLWVRRLTTAGIVGIVLLVLTLTVIRARSLNVTVARVQPDRVEATEYGDPGETVGRYLGFNYEERFRGRLVFALKSVKTLATASGWNEIEGVRLELFQLDGERVVVSCDAASFNDKTRAARLRGSIHIQFPDGGFVETDRGSFDAASRRFSTDGPATFVGSEGVGEAGRILYWLDDDRLKLEGGVTFKTQGGARLEAPSLVYYQEEGRGALSEGCRLFMSGIAAEARRGEVELDGPEGSPVQLALLGGVTVSGRDVGKASYLALNADRLQATRTGGEIWEITASSDASWVEGEFFDGPGYLYRRLQSSEVLGMVAPEGLIRVIARRQLCLFEVPVEGPPRQVASDKGTFRLDDERGLDLTLEGSVQVDNETVLASGARADHSGATGVTLLKGDPSQRKRVTLASGRGELTCDEAQFEQQSGRAEARGNVQGHLEEAQFLMGNGEVPESSTLHFAAKTMLVEEEGAVFHLKDTARAWQGNNLLLADEAIYRTDEGSLRAFGHVRTTFLAPPPPNAEDAPDQEVLVVARSLDYSTSPEGAVALYSGNVRYSDSEHTMSTAELTVVFNSQNEIQEVDAEGSVELIHGVSGRRMKGQHAHRDMSTQQLLMTGNPVQVSDEKGNLITGTSLTWDQASGRVTISGGPDARTETILRSEEEL